MGVIFWGFLNYLLNVVLSAYEMIVILFKDFFIVFLKYNFLRFFLFKKLFRED